MIFVTVGAQMPFDRLVRAIDDWAAKRGRGDVFAQIGPSEYRPRRLEWSPFLEPREFRRRVEESALLVAHAGMGSIITALEVGKPILVMPRRGDLRETRNDHQLATAERFRGRAGIEVAMDETELGRRLDALAGAGASVAGVNGARSNGAGSHAAPAPTIGAAASDSLIQAIRRLIFEGGETGA